MTAIIYGLELTTLTFDLDLSPGDRVALEPGVSCRRCELCKDGLYNLCPDLCFFLLTFDLDLAYLVTAYHFSQASHADDVSCIRDATIFDLHT